MEITMKPATDDYLKAYTDLLQRTYETAYTNDELGLMKDCFSKEIFNSADTQNYLKSNLVSNDKQQCWLALQDEQLVGTITIKDKGNEYELTGFYVDSPYQGKGIGKMLWHKALQFAKHKDIILDT